MQAQDLNPEEKLCWLQLIQSENVGPKTFFDLLQYFGSAEVALEAAPELSRKGGARKAIKICPRDKALYYLETLHAYGADLVAFGENDYPKYLSHINPPPPLICIKGNLELAQRPVISIVGSRNASAVGLKLARNFARELGEQGVTICSGLARGVDTAAHEASLTTGTIAVLAGGLDHIYPPENAGLHEAIADQGLLVSEMMPGTVPQAQNFPRRNRIISGLSLGVMVAEAAKRSGSLITARFAGEQGRECFAVPGSPLDPRSSGTNYLLQNGATMALTSEDILTTLQPLIERGFDETDPATFSGVEVKDHIERTPSKQVDTDDILDTERENLLSLLSATPVDVNDLLRESTSSYSNIHLIILELELAGRLSRHSGNQVSLIDFG